MSDINLAYNDRIRYTLQNKSQGSLIITEPIGYKNDEKELTRHDQYHGIISRFSNASKFTGSGKDYIKLIDDIEGINGEIISKREERHPQTDEWNLSYSGYLDLSTLELENNEASIKFNSGGIEQLLKARESEQVEIDRTTTIDGKTIPALEPITVGMDGRRIFLKTKYEVQEVENKVRLYNQTNGQTRGSTTPVPLNLTGKSHEAAQSPIVSTLVGDNTWDRSGNGETGLMLFAISDRDRILKIKFSVSFKVNFLQFDDINFFRFWLRLATYKNASDYIFKENRMLFTDDSYSRLNGKTFSVNFEDTITLLAGESLALVFDQNFDGANGHSAHLEIQPENIVSSFFIEEDSFFEKSQSKAVLAHELLDRLVTIGTNKENAFYSEFLGRTDLGYPVDGPGSLIGVAHGFWIRQFDKLPIPTENPKVENLFKPLTTSFKDAVASLDAVHNIGIGIETVGNKERVRLEELSYFYNNNVTIRLPLQVKKVKRYKATNYYYSGLEFGSEKGGDYQEAMGLDEYNTKSTFTTVINRVKETYSKISKYRPDSYGMEFARRKPKSLNDTEDTPYDTDNFIMDLKRGVTSIFEQRKWQDDFEKEPTGVFNPESATNLRFSPFNCLLRHSWWFGGGFKKYLTDYVSYGSSTANSQLKTKLIGKNEYAENGNIINSELMKARFFPEWIEFEHVCSFEVMQMVEGKTVILGKEIMNFYGLVEFINENNEKEKGFLFNLKPNGKGQWKVLKSNR
ncbi:MAG: hypothetical protein V4683_11840 [Bacteroidota bacterium]